MANKKEVMIAGNAGVTGSSMKFGYSLNDKFSIRGNYHLSTPLKYRGSEFETGLMMVKSDSSDMGAGKGITLGCGFGNNYENNPGVSIKNFRGEFVKPFAILTLGSAHKTKSIGNFIFVDGSFSLKLNYLIYNGFKATSINNIPTEKKFDTNIFFTEPYFNFNLGLKWFRIDLGIGAIIKKKYEFDKNMAIFPLEANAGIIFFLGKKSIVRQK